MAMDADLAGTGAGLGLYGLWQRLILAQPGKPVDTLTRVDWLQGPVLYVDLRQPAPMAPIASTCLDEVTPSQALALAAQEGFAGRLRLDGSEAEWLRDIDFRPCPLGDRGRLERHGDLLIETGIEADYIEHWQRLPTARDAISGSARFVGAGDEGGDGSATERSVILVRHGNRFGYARARAAGLLGAGENLLARVAGADDRTGRALIDCEISLGTISAEGWRIERSSLPWRVGATLLGPGAALMGARLTVNDVDGAGAPTARVLRLAELHGSLLPMDEVFAAAQPLAPLMPWGQADMVPFTAVPVVDISALGNGDAAAETAAVGAIRRAAGEVGFLHVTGHGIAPAVIERLRAAARRFFDQPADRKMASYIGRSTCHRGYVPEGEEQLGAPAPGMKRDRKEAFDLALDLDPASVPADHPLLGGNQWPDLPGFREDVMAYYGAVFAVGQRLLRGFALALGESADAFDTMVTTPPSQLRLLHYPHDADAADAPGIGAHTDYEMFTLLLATGPGLEVMNQAGAWIDAPPVPGALVVNIGDMLEYLSAGRFVATSHRVRKVAEERWSFPLFFALDYDVALRPLGQPQAEPIRTGEHLFAQTAQTFAYLKDRVARGEIALPQGARPVSSFGPQAAKAPAATSGGAAISTLTTTTTATLA
jgi:isopenicillin N synthase-like dioxygenase